MRRFVAPHSSQNTDFLYVESLHLWGTLKNAAHPTTQGLIILPNQWLLRAVNTAEYTLEFSSLFSPLTWYTVLLVSRTMPRQNFIRTIFAKHSWQWHGLLLALYELLAQHGYYHSSHISSFYVIHGSAVGKGIISRISNRIWSISPLGHWFESTLLSAVIENHCHLIAFQCPIWHELVVPA